MVLGRLRSSWRPCPPVPRPTALAVEAVALWRSWRPMGATPWPILLIPCPNHSVRKGRENLLGATLRCGRHDGGMAAVIRAVLPRWPLPVRSRIRGARMC